MEKLVRYLHLQTDRIRAIVLIADDQFTPETYHQLRVGIKKIDALAKLAKHTRKDYSEEKYMKKLEEIFEQAGKVRELQIEKDYLQASAYANILSGLILSLDQNVESERQRFIELKNASNGFRSMQPGNLETCLLGLSKDDAKEYVNNSSKKLLKKIRSKGLKNSQVHVLRKELKTMHYIQKASNLKKDKKSMLAQSKDLSELIGKWHDGRVLLQQFKAVLSLNKHSQSQSAALSDIRMNIKNQTGQRFGKIEKVIKKLR